MRFISHAACRRMLFSRTDLLLYLSLAPLIVMAFIGFSRMDELLAVRFRRGRAELRRGRISPALLADFEDIARRFPEADGVARCLRRSPRPELETAKLPDAMAQRLRNVLALHVHRLERDASVQASGVSLALSRAYHTAFVLAVIGTIGAVMFFVAGNH